MGDVMKNFLANMLETFKAKNPKVWAVVFIIALVLQFGVRVLIGYIPFPGIDDVIVQLPPDFLTIDWILRQMNIYVNKMTMDIILTILIGITGSKSSQFLDKDKMEKVYDKQKMPELEKQKEVIEKVIEKKKHKK